MNRAKVLFLLLILSLTVPLFFFRDINTRKGLADDLLVYCAAGLRKPMQVAAQEYEEEFGVKVALQFSGSGTLLGNLEASGVGDLYLAADSSYIEIARNKNLVEEAIPVCQLTAGLAVRKSNPLNLTKLTDLIDNETVRVVLANPEAASVGKFTKKVLKEHGHWEAVSSKALAMKPTVNELANDIKIGAADVGIVWDAIANQYPELEFVHLPEFDLEKKLVTIGVLNSTNDPTAALKFARFVSASDRGQKAFNDSGYEIAFGDKWEEVPEILLYSGAMLSPAIRNRIESFEKREGIDIQFVPNGCGILVSQMKAGARPDAYFSCDISFMNDVKELFDPPRTVSANDIVILIKENMSDKIKSLNDLTGLGIKVGRAHPEKSALGALTVRLLNEEKINLEDNLQLDSATGDFLVNQLRAGSLDAVLVYRSNAKASPSTLKESRIVELNNPLAVARQPFAVGNGSYHKHLVERLFTYLTGEEGKAEFLKYGFKWELNN